MSLLDIIKDGYPRCIKTHDGGKLTIGKDVYIGPFSTIDCRIEISIGEGTKIGPGVGIFDFDHDLNNPSLGGIREPVKIGKGCWIGANTVILKGVTLGEGCIVGAGSIVTHSFPSFSILYGNPARRRI